MNLKSSLKNSLSSFAGYIVALMIGFISQAIFIKILGTEYLGLNGLFTNIISILGIVELGIGSAIIYNLYKPIKNEDQETIKSLMNFYKKTYNIIALIVSVIGLLIIPFLHLFVNTNIDININYIYLLFIIDAVFSYLLCYKRSILYADQKNYVINCIHIIYIMILNIFQIIFLFIFKSYYIYLIIKIITRIFENFLISLYVNKNYPFLKEKSKKLSKSLEKDIQKKIKALFFHKIGGFIINGTDNIIISKYLGLTTVGLYSNYYLIINSLNSIFGQTIISLTANIGHLLTKNLKEKNYEVFKKVRFINFWIACFSGVGLFLLTEPFIKIWLGEQYLLPNAVLIVLVFNYFQKMMRNSYMIFKEAAGIYYEDRYVPIIESVVNLVSSIILVKTFGLVGVFIGTVLSGMILWIYSYPKYVYKKLFNKSYSNYIKEIIFYVLIFFLIAICSFLISQLLTFNNVLISMIIRLMITIIIPNTMIIIIFINNDNFIYFKNIFKKIIYKKIKNLKEVK